MATPNVSATLEGEGDPMSDNFLRTDGGNGVKARSDSLRGASAKGVDVSSDTLDNEHVMPARPDDSEPDVGQKHSVKARSDSVRGASTKGVDVSSDSLDSEHVMPARLDETSDTMKDDVDGAVVSRFFDNWDDNLSHPYRKVQLFTCNQQPGERKGYFLKMVPDDSGLNGFKVTTNGVQTDEYAVWIARFIQNDNKQQTLVFINEKCSRETQKTCVLSTVKVGKKDYFLTGKKLDNVPENLADIDSTFGFFKHAKAIGSELLFLKSLLTTDDNELLVGFDGTGQPLPLNKVKKYSDDFQAFFKIIPGEYID